MKIIWANKELWKWPMSGTLFNIKSTLNFCTYGYRIQHKSYKYLNIKLRSGLKKVGVNGKAQSKQLFI